MVAVLIEQATRPRKDSVRLTQTCDLQCELYFEITFPNGHLEHDDLLQPLG
jgi:hypothetical protein